MGCCDLYVRPVRLHHCVRSFERHGTIPQGRATGAPTATFRKFLGSTSNNVAEYTGVNACMERALLQQHTHVLFEVDAMIETNQLAHRNPWACRAECLHTLHSRCVTIGNELTSMGIIWEVRHIYREFNQTTDALANQSIDEMDTNCASDGW